MSLKDLTEGPLDNFRLNTLNYYSETEKPVFFGHYWLEGHPEIIKKMFVVLIKA
jgi:hypothetical protein